MSRLSDVSKLHPAIRQSVKAIRTQLHKENHPFEVFEAFRTPDRQRYLYAKGRSTKGPKVTWVGPWRSIHQYGLAVDFVLKKNGKWSWDDSGQNAAAWSRMHEIAKENGMTPIYSSKSGKLLEKPHVQLAGISSKQLYQGKYPDGGDVTWAEQLGDLIEGWQGSQTPPMPPANLPTRPPLENSEDEEDETMSADEIFALVHPFVMRWEGDKYTDNPRDNGGATKYGITQATLENWLSRKVNKSEVRNLTRQTADQIFKANYFDRAKCMHMSPRAAAVVYNGAVLHGVHRSGNFVQTALNTLGTKVDGAAIGVDGVIGQQTLAGIKNTDADKLSQAYIQIQEDFLSRHEDFDYYGKGWLNRTNALRTFIKTLPTGSIISGDSDMQVPDNNSGIDIAEILELLRSLSQNSNGSNSTETRVSELGSRTDPPVGNSNDAVLVLLAKLLESRTGTSIPIPNDEPVNTPMGDALGKGVGNLLNGRKTIIGLLGLALTVVFPQADLLLNGGTVSFLSKFTPELIALFGGATGWGMFHKLEKAIYRVGGRGKR